MNRVLNLKESVEKIVRGWLPKEANVPKVPNKKGIQTRMETDKQNSTSFKTKRWLHGSSAFISALWRQRSRKFKLDAIFFGVFLIILLLPLVTTDLVNFHLYDFGVWIFLISYFLLRWSVSFYFERKTLRNNHSSEEMSTKLRLGGTIVCVFAFALWVYSRYLLDFVYLAPANPSPLPFYLGLLGILLLSLGWGIFIFGRKRSKNSLNARLQTTPNNFIQRENEKIVVNEKVRWSSGLGYFGGFFFALFSILQVINSGSGFVWWNGRFVYGIVVFFSGIIDLAAGIIGSYGAFIGKKQGGNIMITAGILGLLCAPIYGIVFGGLLILGGAIAYIEKPCVASEPKMDSKYARFGNFRKPLTFAVVIVTVFAIVSIILLNPPAVQVNGCSLGSGTAKAGQADPLLISLQSNDAQNSHSIQIEFSSSSQVRFLNGSNELGRSGSVAWYIHENLDSKAKVTNQISVVSSLDAGVAQITYQVTVTVWMDGSQIFNKILDLSVQNT